MARTITLDMSVHRFKKGRKGRADYEFPQAVYVVGGLTIEEDKSVETVLKGKKGELPVVIRWDSGRQIFCATRRAKENIRFVLPTELSPSEPLGNFDVGGQNVKTGKFTNWSASLVIHDRT